ncbi:MAG: hypothetical protein QXU40_00215 [Candidatus Pacearchaeota archaeon]
MYERENLLRIFKETKKALERGDATKIRNLSNQTTNSASLTQDPDNIASAVIVYSLSKIIERENYKNLKGWNEFYKKYIYCIDKAIEALKENNEEKLRNYLREIIESVEILEGDFKQNIRDVFQKAKINKASKIYEHGISLELTAKLLGITLYDLISYIGNREDPSHTRSTKISEKERIENIEEFFK